MPLLRFTESYSAALIFSTLVAGSNGCQLYERSSNDVRPDAAVSAVGSDAQGHDLFDAGSISQSSSDATLMVPTTDAAVGASGLTWSPKTATMFPPVDDTTPTLAYDTVRQQAVLFVELGWRVGGNSGDEDETWIWDGTTWAMHMPDHSPAYDMGAGASATFDEANGTMVTFGGLISGSPWTSSTTTGQTWLWDGNDWARQFPSVVPRQRYAASMAYDSVRQQSLLFGGIDSEPGADAGDNVYNYLNDTWAWDGTAWTELDAGAGPSQRSAANICFDRVRGELVLFGGSSNPAGTYGEEVEYDDTWLWNGTTWRQVFPEHSPPGRTSAGFAFDQVHGVAMLVGGVGANDSGEFTDTWTWDGTDWTQLVVVPTIDRTSAYEIFDTKKQQLMLFANDDYANGSNQWWLTWP